jgi:transcriptional regulator with XRE-family HTH domain
MRAFGRWCDARRGRRREVARALGVSPQLVTEWIKLRRMPRLDRALRLAELMREGRRPTGPLERVSEAPEVSWPDGPVIPLR